MSNINELKAKFASLEGREKKLLMTGTLVVLIFLVYLTAYKPMVTSISSLKQSNIENQQLLVWMTQSAASIKKSTGGGNKAKSRNGRSLNQLINSAASKAKISISRSQPRDNNQHQIWLDQVVFSELLLWLDVLQKDYGIFVNNINLGASDKSGTVRVNLTFQDSGS